MAKVSLNTIKNWFKTGLKPSQQQFWDTWDSFWHKDEQISIDDIDGVDNIYDEITNHTNDVNAHPNLLANSRNYPFLAKQRFKGIGNTNNAIWQAGDIGVGFLSSGKFLSKCFYIGPDANDFSLEVDNINNWFGETLDEYLTNEF